MAWHRFIADQAFDPTQVRPLVLASWERAKKYQVDPYFGNTSLDLTPNETQKLLEKNRALIHAARPYLEKIYKLVQETGFYIVLCDQDGYILDLLNDSELMKQYHKDPLLTLGANRSERAVGTNSIGTALFCKEPVQIWGEEHFIQSHKAYTCVGAPIRSANREVIGCLSITGPESGLHAHTLAIAVATADNIELALAKASVSFGESKPDNAITFDDIIGESDAIRKVKEKAKKVAPTRSSVLIQGESGTGKELFALAVHNASNRRNGPFIPINCGAIPKELIESELFGYEEGAFTGALKGGKTGKLEAASGGTLFLDEVESMPPDVQVKLLRALSTLKITKVGSNQERPVDIRIISATKKSLLQEADLGNFREDLYYRINVITLSLPPLRDRKEDIRLLIDYHVQKMCSSFGLKTVKTAESFYETLENCPLRGNVRELINLLESALVLAGDDWVLDRDSLPETLSQQENRPALIQQVKSQLATEEQKEQEIQRIKEALLEAEGNVGKAAKILGVARSTLYKRIRRLEPQSDVPKG